MTLEQTINTEIEVHAVPQAQPQRRQRLPKQNAVNFDESDEDE